MSYCQLLIKCQRSMLIISPLNRHNNSSSRAAAQPACPDCPRRWSTRQRRQQLGKNNVLHRRQFQARWPTPIKSMLCPRRWRRRANPGWADCAKSRAALRGQRRQQRMATMAGRRWRHFNESLESQFFQQFSPFYVCLNISQYLLIDR